MVVQESERSIKLLSVFLVRMSVYLTECSCWCTFEVAAGLHGHPVSFFYEYRSGSMFSCSSRTCGSTDDVNHRHAVRMEKKGAITRTNGHRPIQRHFTRTSCISSSLFLLSLYRIDTVYIYICVCMSLFIYDLSLFLRVLVFFFFSIVALYTSQVFPLLRLSIRTGSSSLSRNRCRSRALVWRVATLDKTVFSVKQVDTIVESRSRTVILYSTYCKYGRI